VVGMASLGGYKGWGDRPFSNERVGRVAQGVPFLSQKKKYISGNFGHLRLRRYQKA
jgi:hypothetical protein